MIDGLIVEATGSSPLARGLQTQPGRPHPRARIIPARAGFTARTPHRSTPVPDHPRSRGVYSQPGSPTVCVSGSSPLARGLRRRAYGRRGQERIIPARAGFTGSASPPPRGPGDHPRSRGVYHRQCTCTNSKTGSSPLARGLRMMKPRRSGRGRIIPARAGFTVTTPVRRPPPRDHPRSRGVYGAIQRADQLNVGSSPLARGLLTRRLHRVLSARIIPARAGFTTVLRPGAVVYQDHPRSRGVYPVITSKCSLRPGSSPLARGLPVPRDPGDRPPGIIPARAGFT